MSLSGAIDSGSRPGSANHLKPDFTNWSPFLSLLQAFLSFSHSLSLTEEFLPPSAKNASGRNQSGRPAATQDTTTGFSESSFRTQFIGNGTSICKSLEAKLASLRRFTAAVSLVSFPQKAMVDPYMSSGVDG